MSTTRLKWAAGFYWTGVVTTLACITLVAVGNSEAVHRFEHTSFPLSWAFAGIAMIAFMAAELCRSEKSFQKRAQDGGSKPGTEPATVEVLAFPGIRAGEGKSVC
jgi:hypothetical protein